MTIKNFYRGLVVLFAVFSCVSLYARRDEGLVCYFDFDSEQKALENPAKDVLGLDEAKLRGNSIKASVEPGKFRNSIAFSNSNGDRSINNYALSLGRMDSTYNNDSFTVAFWYSSSKAGTTSAALAGNLDMRRADENGWAITLINGKAFIANIGGTKIVQPFNQIYDGKWHHVAIVVDRVAGTISFYGDGKKLSSKKMPKGRIGSGLDTYLGAGANGYFGAPGIAKEKAFVDDFGIWNRPLTDIEIARIWNEGTGARIPEPSALPLLAGLLALAVFVARRRRRSAAISSK